MLIDYLETLAKAKQTRRESLKITDNRSTAPMLSVVTGNLILDTSVFAFFETLQLFRFKNITCLNPANVIHIILHIDTLQVPL